MSKGGNNGGNWPSTTGKPSGGGRGNNSTGSNSENPNGPRGWSLNPINPERIKVLERRARKATAALEHAVRVYEKHINDKLRKWSKSDAGRHNSYN